MGKKLTIDVETYNKAFRAGRGKGRVSKPYDRGWRDGMDWVDQIVRLLAKRYVLNEDGDLVEPRAQSQSDEEGFRT